MEGKTNLNLQGQEIARLWNLKGNGICKEWNYGIEFARIGICK